MSTQRPSITLVQRVPDAAWFERQILVHKLGDMFVLDAPTLAEHLAGNVAGANADAVQVDGPTLQMILHGALEQGRYDHARDCGMMASLSNRCTCWRAKAKAMLGSLLLGQPDRFNAFNAEWEQTLSLSKQPDRFLVDRDERGRIISVVDRDTGRVHTPAGWAE